VSRRSSAALTVAAIAPGPPRLEPPADLQGAARAEFVHLVASVPASHFQPEDLSLLHLYCVAVVQAKFAAAKVEAALQASTSPESWFKMQATAMRDVTMLSARLRIGPRSRSTNQRTPKPTLPVSYYEKMREREL
jgi:phage terminase small subunit